jgi:putative transposase
MRFLK